MATTGRRVTQLQKFVPSELSPVSSRLEPSGIENGRASTVDEGYQHKARSPLFPSPLKQSLVHESIDRVTGYSAVSAISSIFNTVQYQGSASLAKAVFAAMIPICRNYLHLAREVHYQADRHCGVANSSRASLQILN